MPLFFILLCLTICADGQSRDLKIESVADFKNGAKVALLVGVGAYPAESGLSSLKYPVNDADALGTVLERQGYLVQKLTDTKASRGIIRKALNDLGQAINPNQGSFLFFFAGHGFAQNGVNYLATYGVSTDDLKDEGLPITEVERLMKKSKAKRLMLFVDACRNEPRRGSRDAAQLSFSNLKASEGLRALYATKAGSLSYEADELRHGLFSHFLVEGLKGEAANPADGFVTFRGISDYVTAMVKAYSIKLGKVQVPFEAGESSGDFLIGQLPRINVTPAVSAGSPFDQKGSINKLSASGQRRFSEQAVVRESGLKTRQVAGQGEFIQACEQIVNSGFFRACNFRFQERVLNGLAGYDVQFIVEEIIPTLAAIIDIPGTQEDKVWTELANQDPLVRKEIPATSAASNRYVAAIEQLLLFQGSPQKIATKMEGFGSGSLLVVFRPANWPQVRAIIFEGNRAILTKQLEASFLKVANGAAYTERECAQLVERSLRPLYEERGRLNAKFLDLRITASGGDATVSVRVNEGQVYKLGRIQISPDSTSGGDPIIRKEALLQLAAFPSGRIANWNLVNESIERIRAVLKRSGFLKPAINQSRNFVEENTVNLVLSISVGKKYVLGQLMLPGLNAAEEQIVRKKWLIEVGKPMDELYYLDFSKSIFSDKSFARFKGRRVLQDLELDTPNPGQVNVTLQFR